MEIEIDEDRENDKENLNIIILNSYVNHTYKYNQTSLNMCMRKQRKKHTLQEPKYEIQYLSHSEGDVRCGNKEKENEGLRICGLCNIR